MYLNHYRTFYSENLHVFSDGTRAFFDPTTYSRISSGLSYPVLELAKKVRLPDLSPISGKTAFILAGGNGHFAGIKPKEPVLPELDYDYQIRPLTLTQIFAQQEAKLYGDIHYISVDHSACASSLLVLEKAFYLLQHKGYNRVIVLSVEDAVCGMSINFFKQAGVFPKKETSAFDAINEGFFLGQGAVTAVFENYRTESSIARLVGVASASEDHTNALGMRPDGQGYVRAIESLPSVQEVSIVKTHGTGTNTNNGAEKEALHRVLHQPFVATSYKPKIGHTLGASGLLETILLLEDIKTTGAVPPIANRTEEDKVFLSDYASAPEGLILSLAAGMGNIYSAATWEKL